MLLGRIDPWPDELRGEETNPGSVDTMWQVSKLHLFVARSTLLELIPFTQIRRSTACISLALTLLADGWQCRLHLLGTTVQHRSVEASL